MGNMEYKFYRFTENTSWDDEAKFINYQAEQGWRVVAVIIPGSDGVLLMEREKKAAPDLGAQAEP